MSTINVDYEACNGCRMCFKVCYVDVWRYDDEEDKPIVAYPEDCTACNMCELECPTGAIEVVVDYENRPWPPVIERGFPYVPGKAEI
jgi:NAD-dependent dihydropyrimidine dehydrogenase PreA subunit